MGNVDEEGDVDVVDLLGVLVVGGLDLKVWLDFVGDGEEGE